MTRVSTVEAPVGIGKPKRRTAWELFKDMPLLVKIAAVWLLIVIFGAIYAKLDTNVFGGVLPLQDPDLQTNLYDPATRKIGEGSPLDAPSGSHLLGTDALARDTFARLVHGAWVSMIVAFVAAMCGVVVGGFLGSLVGFVRGRTETIIMAMVDVILSFPALILLLAVVAVFNARDLWTIAFLIGFLSIPAYTRVARANALAISNREFVLAARSFGTKPTTILWREIIPNVLPTLLSYAMVAGAYVVVVEGSLSFLGLSVQPPAATWGNMINLARGDMKVNLFQIAIPCLVLSFTVLCLNQVGDWLQKQKSNRSSAL